MMQYSATDGLLPRLLQTVGFSPQGAVLLASGHEPAPQVAHLSARLAEQDVGRFVAARCQALVITSACGALIIIDFVSNAQSRAEAAQPQVLACDAIELGGGQARLWAQNGTLHIRAHTIDVMAQGEQRLRGATVHIG